MKYFFKNTDELQQYVGVQQTLSVDALKPFLINDLAEREVVKILGRTLYDELLTAYDNENLTPVQEALLPFVQAPMASLAVYSYLQEAAVRISDTGIQTDRENTAFQWQQEKVESQYLQTAYNRLDALIRHLHQNKASYSGWEQSDEYASTRAFFVNTPKEFQAFVNIGESYRTLIALRPSMRQVEESKVRPLLTTPLFDELKAAIKAGSLNDNMNALMRFIQPAVAFFTIAQGIEDLNMEIAPDGSFVHSLRAQSSANIKERTRAPITEIERQSERMRQRGEEWLKSLREFLNENASTTLYAAYFSSKNYQGTGAAETYVQNPESKIWNAL